MNQTQPEPTENPQSLSDGFIISSLPCSCSKCRSNPNDVDACLHEEDRGITRWKVRSNQIDEDEDSEDINKLTVKELKAICRTCHLPVSGRKDALIARIVPFLEALQQTIEEESNDVNDVDENIVEDVENVDGLQTFCVRIRVSMCFV